MEQTIAILCHNVGPYHAARYRELAKALHGICVIQLARAQGKYPWQNEKDLSGVHLITLSDKALEESSPAELRASVQRALGDIRPDLIVTVGYVEPAMRQAAFWANKNKVRCVMTTATWRGRQKRSPVKEALKRPWCRRMYDALFLPGIRAEQYYSSLGFPISKIWRGVDVVDNEHFLSGASRARHNEVLLKKARQLPDNYFFCVARHSPEKNIAFLLRAFRRYRDLGGSWGLVLAGDGPDRTRLEMLAGRLDLTDVRFLGWVDYNELPIYYGLSNALILPSLEEPWGLAVNEAMACGLPIVISRHCGCSPELCWRGINGFDFDPEDQKELVAILLKMDSQKVDVRSLGEASQRIIAAFSPQSWAAALSDCIRTLLNSSPGRI